MLYRAEWLEMVARFQRQQEFIMSDLPIEAQMGIFNVDCRLLRHQLQVCSHFHPHTISPVASSLSSDGCSQEGANRLAETCFFNLQEDATELTEGIFSNLKVWL